MSLIPVNFCLMNRTVPSLSLCYTFTLQPMTLSILLPKSWQFLNPPAFRNSLHIRYGPKNLKVQNSWLSAGIGCVMLYQYTTDSFLVPQEGTEPHTEQPANNGNRRSAPCSSPPRANGRRRCSERQEYTRERDSIRNEGGGNERWRRTEAGVRNTDYPVPAALAAGGSGESGAFGWTKNSVARDGGHCLAESQAGFIRFEVPPERPGDASHTLVSSILWLLPAALRPTFLSAA